jgi:hypothetical protein
VIFSRKIFLFPQKLFPRQFRIISQFSFHWRNPLTMPPSLSDLTHCGCRRKGAWDVISKPWNCWIVGSPVYIWEMEAKIYESCLKIWVKSSFKTPNKEKEYFTSQLNIVQEQIEEGKVTTKLHQREKKLVKICTNPIDQKKRLGGSSQGAYD